MFTQRKTTLITGTDGATTTASKTISLGKKFGYIIGFEFKGDDADVDTNATLEVVDAAGRIIVPATALDAGQDDSTVKATNQDYSTVGVYRSLVENEGVGTATTGTKMRGEASPTDNVGGTRGVFAQGPVTINIAAGTDGDVHQVVLHVEV